jgi:hypothetical protein
MHSSLLRRTATSCVLLLGLVLTLARAGDAQAQTTATPTPWIVLKCQFADDTSSPGAPPVLNDLFTSSGAGKGGMFDYWRDMSGGAVSLAGSTVAPGWFRMSMTLEAAKKMVWPAARDDVIKDCIHAADPSVDFRPFFGIVVATNSNIDAGSTGRQTLWLDGGWRTYGLVHLDRGAWSGVWAAHEMGHGYGLDDSFSNEQRVSFQPDGRYGDHWDIMSAHTFGGQSSTFADVTFGSSGPALSGANRDLLGWIPGSRIVTVNTLSGGSIIKLSALDGGPTGNPRLAKIGLGFSTRSFAVEFRMADGWDRGVGRDAVSVRRVENGKTFLLKSTSGAFDLQAGDAVTDSFEDLSISVLGIDSAQRTATVHIGPMPPWSLRTNATLTPRPNAAGWNNSAVDVDLQATGGASPSAWVQSITTSATGADAQPTTTHANSAVRLRLTKPGQTDLVYAAREYSGAGELPRKLPVRIDTTAPKTTATITRSGGTNTILLNATDEPGGSGLKSLEYYAVGANPIPMSSTTQSSATITVSKPGATTVFFWATDKADNVEGPHSRWLRPIPVVSPPMLDFLAPPGAVTQPQTVVLRNQGDTTLSLKGVASTDAAFTVTTNPVAPCGTTLLPNGSCRIDVVFNPFSVTSYQGSLNISTDAPSPTLSVPLTGVGEAAQLEFVPGSLTFPATVLRKTSPAQTATIRNPGSVPLVLNEVTPGSGGDYTVTDDRCGPYPRTLQPGSACEVDVAFSPIYDGHRLGGLGVRSNVPGPMQLLPLSGQGIAQPELTATPANLDFGDQPLNTSGAPARVEVTNTGTAPLEISAIAIAGATPSDFRIVGGSCVPTIKDPVVVVGAEQTCDLELDFRPTDLGARPATLDVTSNAPGPASVVTLAGTGIATPDITFDPTPVSFADQTVGTSSAPRSIVVTNATADTSLLERFELDGKARDEFVVAQDTCSGIKLAAGASCDVSLEFAPTAIGLRTATLLATDHTGAVHETLLQGTGTGAELAFEPATADFGPWPIGATDRRDIVIRNTGNAPATITSVGTTTADFLNNQWCVGLVIGPGGFCSLRVAFSPKAGGLRQADLVVSSSALGSPARMPLSGTGTVPGIALDANALDFGAQAVGSTSAPKSVTITSSGTAPLSMNEVKLTGANAADFTMTENCSFRGHMPGAACTVTVTFKPTAPGGRTADVVINSNAAGSPHTVMLAGIGT